MRLLLDTCTFYWLNSSVAHVPQRVRDLCAEEDNQLYLSSVSVWEIVVKHRAGKLPLPVSPREYITNCRRANAIVSLRFQEDDAFHLPMLPMLHKDPFDRMLICQAIGHGLTILTPDEKITRYPVLTTW